MLFAVEPTDLEKLAQYTILGLTFGCLYALIALGYTMVYGIVELINFAHGDLFMLGGFVGLTVLGFFKLTGDGSVANMSIGYLVLAVGAAMAASMAFCALLNVGIDFAVYQPLRNAPKLAPLVSAIGVSFILLNAGLFWGQGPESQKFPDVYGKTADGDLSVNLLEKLATDSGGRMMLGDLDTANVRLTAKQVAVFAVTLPLMLVLTLFVKFSKLGKAMRAVAQNPTAARLMGINVNGVIRLTFLIGGALAGAASVIFCLTLGTVRYDMGYQNGLYAFTAAVVGGIGRLPGAVLGGLLIGLVQAYGSGFIDDKWNGPLIFGILILILVFRPTGLLGSPAREKV